MKELETKRRITVPEVQSRFPQIKDFLLSSASALNVLQRLPTRDINLETRIAKSAKEFLELHSVGALLVDAQSFTGEGIKVIQYATRGALNKRGNSHLRRYAQEQGYSDEIRDCDEATPVDPLGSVFFVRGFKRGDTLGYGPDSVLGNDWFLHFGMGNQYLVPVGGLQDITLEMVDHGF